MLMAKEIEIKTVIRPLCLLEVRTALMNIADGEHLTVWVSEGFLQKAIVEALSG